MDVHDIRYLHDDSLPEDDELGDYFSLPQFLTKKNLISAGIIGVLVLSIGIVTLNISSRTTTQSSAKTDSELDVSPEPTVEKVVVKGKVTCLKSRTLQENECDIAIKTPEGDTYSLENVRYEDVVSGAIVPGKDVTVTGSIVPFASSGSSFAGGSVGSNLVSGTLYLDNPGGGSLQQSSTPPSSTPSPTIFLTPTPTPLPFSVPTPSVNYLSVKYIVDNKDLLVGQNVPLGAYIVSTQQPDPDCAQGEDCSLVQFIVNDATGTGRDISYDTLLIANTTNEDEILFTPGQKIYATVTVVVVEGQVSLLLNIID